MIKGQKRISKRQPVPKRIHDQIPFEESQEQNSSKQNVSIPRSAKNIISENLDLLEKQYDESEIVLNTFNWMNLHEIERSQTSFEYATLHLGETYHPKVVPCRDEQKQEIGSFIEEGMATKGCRETLYISGVPGIGKTLCVNEVVAKMCNHRKQSIQTIFVNAMNLKKQKDIFKMIWEKLSGTSRGSMNALYNLNELFTKGFVEQGGKIIVSSTKLIVIDEMDYLHTKDHEVIYNILEWTHQKKSRIILIAISNTIDFPETLSSKLASRMGNKRIIFKPYSSKQIEAILKQRISTADVFEDQAVEYICKRIAKCSSDIRKCLFIMRDSITSYVNQCARNGVSPKRVPLSMLAAVHTDSINDFLVKNFTNFHRMHKIVLITLAKYFRYENIACAYTELHIRCKQHIDGGQFTLKPVIYDLRDNGFITFRNETIRTDRRINKGVKLHKQFQEEHITLLLPVDAILYAALQDGTNMISIEE